ncbi:hypothetical protein CI109_104546 [Kwoniella shandongensis]|uniref:Uncharacterized protein n=1 Tax=Kwoniella shandongensis TaxID=1734106 RepID=A0A5M6BVN3_9TREE|nr:uncharacterized protein CI109_005564 [Kwoniella shandongensis]KAA5526130.1 hypothetical protein CI109_005564 [Kwoniella shandongensis]
MPPRRSARASLPTPATSTTSTSTTPSTKPRQPRRSMPNTGMQTPASLTDGETELGEEIKEEEGELGGEDERVKREASFDSPFNDGSASESSSKKYKLESVTIPTRRSRLGLDKTESADNLTLGSPAPKGVNGRGSSMLKSEGVDEEMLSAKEEQISEEEEEQIEAFKPKPKAKGKAQKPAHQPFNVGKHSNVKKASAASLAFDKPKRAAATKPKGKGKGKKVLTPPASDEEEKTESEFEAPDDEDYAMDSDQETKQLNKAIEESTKAATRAKRGNQKALRAAVARAAEKRNKSSRGDVTPSTKGQASGTVTPWSGDSSAVNDADITPLSDDDTGLSSLPSDFSEAEYSSDDSDVSVPKTKKGKGKANGNKKFQGRGQTLDGKWDDELADELGSEGEGLDPDERRVMTIKKMRAKAREERKQAEEEAQPRKMKEKELSKKLGRKLTNGEKNLVALSMHHPELEDVWGDLQTKVVPVKPITMEAHPSLKLTLLPFQKESLYWMKKQEEGPWKGGMLADEMGMGKTIQTIALLLSEPRRKPSLVVAPVVALMQWKNEIETHAEGFTTVLWHGQGRMKAAELKKYDVVLVSYGTLEASFRRQQRGFKRGDMFIKEKSPMHEIIWHRVILDEAHNIKERSTNAAKAAFALHASYKWCLSGTPLQNRVGELYSLVRFLGADPFSHYFCKKCDCKSLHWQFKDRRHCDQCGHTPMNHVCFWNTEILSPIARYGIEEGGPGHTAFKKLKILLDRMMLRRTKLERADDLGLPPRTIVVRRDFFSPQEKELYMSLFSNAKRQFATYIDQGTVLNNYSNIFSLITRMRQMACHPDMVLKSKNSILNHGAKEGTVCRICSDTAEDAIVSACKHVFDRECIRQYLEVKQARGHKPECPVCHIEISIDLEAEAIDLEEGGKKARQGILSRLNLDNWRSSSKLEALVEELEKLRNQDCTIKSLVFSQFVSFLDLIAFRLQRAGFNICRLEGGMTPQQRDATIQHFMKNTGVTVFLISLKAGGVALNLTEASMVFMMDSWWNPSVEYQAMDRIHRLGQKRPVKVVKLVIEDSIEDQIVQLQHKKLAMTEAALSQDPDAALGKLTVEDLGFLFKL